MANISLKVYILKIYLSWALILDSIINRYRKKKSNVDIINDNEEHIAIIVRKMREAADVDRQLNVQRKPATKKIAMLDLAMSQINKHNLVEGFLAANVLTGGEWK